MIKLLRIDDRLIHGQVAFAWTKHLGVNCILVANDVVVNDELKKMMLNLAKPPGVNLLLLSVADAVSFLNGEESDKYTTFVLVDKASDALALCKGVKAIGAVNVGGKIPHLYDPFHPAVLRLIKTVIDNGHKEGIWVGMCGEMAGDPRLIPLLVGMGLDEFSMSPPSILKTRKIIGDLEYQAMKQMAEDALQMGSSPFS